MRLCSVGELIELRCRHSYVCSTIVYCDNSSISRGAHSLIINLLTARLVTDNRTHYGT